MDDLLHCPICNNKLRNSHLHNKFLHLVSKTSDYVERICANGHSHFLSFWTDKLTQQVDLLKVSLAPDYSRFIEIDFLNQTSRIIVVQDTNYQYIEVPQVLELDWPELIDLKKKVSLLIVFQ
jgi:hypothetical protein